MKLQRQPTEAGRTAARETRRPIDAASREAERLLWKGEEAERRKTGGRGGPSDRQTDNQETD